MKYSTINFILAMNKKLWNHICLHAFYLTFHLKILQKIWEHCFNQKTLTLNWKLHYFKLVALMAATKVPGAITASTG